MGEPSLVEGVSYDLQRLHGLWMKVAFAQLREPAHPVMGQWSPETAGQRAAYGLWAALGAVVLVVVYPVVVAGLAIRFYARQFDRTATRLGFVGSILLTVLVWGALTVLARYRFTPEGFLAVGAAAAVATVSAALAIGFRLVGGRLTSVVFAYPFAVITIFLPPVVAALFSPAVASAVLPRSTTVAIWLLDNVLTVGGLNEVLRSRFELIGLAFVGMWVGVSVPIGWVLGTLVALADLVRPTDEGDDGE